MATRDKHRQRSMYSYKKNAGLLNTYARKTYFHANEVTKRKSIREYFKGLFSKITKREKTV